MVHACYLLANLVSNLVTFVEVAYQITRKFALNIMVIMAIIRIIIEETTVIIVSRVCLLKFFLENLFLKENILIFE